LVGDGHAAAARRRLSPRDEGVDRSVSAVFLFNLTVTSAADKEDGSTRNGGQAENAHDNTDSNANRLGAAR
jgi:hypothetical protein